MFGIREDYALRALVDLAAHAGGGPVQSRDLAQRQGIPGPYMDQILLQLRRGGIVRSVRGAAGGFLLARPPEEVTVREVLAALRGEPTVLRATRDSTAERLGAYAVAEFWSRLQGAVDAILESTTLRDLVRRQEALSQARTPMFYI